LLKSKTAIPPLKALKTLTKLEPPIVLTTEEPEELPAKARVDINDLSWEDKERILRILFAKMNGVNLVHENDRKPPNEDLDRAKKHRSGFADDDEKNKGGLPDINTSESFSRRTISTNTRGTMNSTRSNTKHSTSSGIFFLIKEMILK
jgi:hypothetical protein